MPSPKPTQTSKPTFDWRKFTPADSPLTPVDLADDPVHRDLHTATLAPGDVALDFTLPIYDFSDGTERGTGESLTLSARAAERPVALVFGSYT